MSDPAVRLSPDSTHLVNSSAQYTVKTCDIATGSCFPRLKADGPFL